MMHAVFRAIKYEFRYLWRATRRAIIRCVVHHGCAHNLTHPEMYLNSYEIAFNNAHCECESRCRNGCSALCVPMKFRRMYVEVGESINTRLTQWNWLFIVIVLHHHKADASTTWKINFAVDISNLENMYFVVWWNLRFAASIFHLCFHLVRRFASSAFQNCALQIKAKRISFAASPSVEWWRSRRQ